MDEANKRKKTVLARASEQALVADTLGGRMHVRWDETAQATPHGQIVFFAEFLATAGVFERWVQDCPLHYSSPNASSARDVLGTLTLGILAGSKRYAHIAGVRGDAVAAKALGLQGLVSEDKQRSVNYLLRLRKTANVKRLIERLFKRQAWSEAPMCGQGWQASEDELRLSGWSRARRVVVLRRRIRNDLALVTKARGKDGHEEQLVLALGHDDVQETAQLWEYTVLATNTQYDIAAIGQLYRDRCDCENGFDELKNQWGWGGFTTQDMHRSQLSARAVALVYNWWSWYVRAANPQARREALTSRPLLLAAVGRATHSGNQTTLYLTPMHAETGLIKSMLANVQAAIRHVRAAAEQLPDLDRWRTLLAYICHRIVGQNTLPTPPPALTAAG